MPNNCRSAKSGMWQSVRIRCGAKSVRIPLVLSSAHLSKPLLPPVTRPCPPVDTPSLPLTCSLKASWTHVPLRRSSWMPSNWMRASIVSVLPRYVRLMCLRIPSRPPPLHLCLSFAPVLPLDGPFHISLIYFCVTHSSALSFGQFMALHVCAAVVAPTTQLNLKYRRRVLS